MMAKRTRPFTKLFFSPIDGRILGAQTGYYCDTCYPSFTDIDVSLSRLHRIDIHPVIVLSQSVQGIYEPPFHFEDRPVP